MSMCTYMCVRVYVGTRRGHCQGPQCLVPQRFAEQTIGRISEIKECDKDRRKRRKMTESGYRSGCNNKKRKISTRSPSLSTMEGSFTVKYVSHALRDGEEEGREVRLNYK